MGARRKASGDVRCGMELTGLPALQCLGSRDTSNKDALHMGPDVNSIIRK